MAMDQALDQAQDSPVLAQALVTTAQALEWVQVLDQAQAQDSTVLGQALVTTAQALAQEWALAWVEMVLTQAQVQTVLTDVS